MRKYIENGGESEGEESEAASEAASSDDERDLKSIVSASVMSASDLNAANEIYSKAARASGPNGKPMRQNQIPMIDIKNTLLDPPSPFFSFFFVTYLLIY